MRKSPFDYKVWNIEEMCGYKPITTYYEDFGIAEYYGEKAIRDTFERALDWKSVCEWWTEIVMVLNWKIWEHYRDNPKYAEIYTELYDKAYDYALCNFNDAELSYFFKTTD